LSSSTEAADVPLVEKAADFDKAVLAFLAK
jgi:hypothetical protein